MSTSTENDADAVHRIARERYAQIAREGKPVQESTCCGPRPAEVARPPGLEGHGHCGGARRSQSRCRVWRSAGPCGVAVRRNGARPRVRGGIRCVPRGPRGG
jgi:hypothetical protein